MENLADISEPHVPVNEQKDQKSLFSICLFWFEWEKRNYRKINFSHKFFPF